MQAGTCGQGSSQGYWSHLQVCGPHRAGGVMWDSAVGPKLGLGPQVCGLAPGATGVGGLLMEGLVCAVGA